MRQYDRDIKVEIEKRERKTEGKRERECDSMEAKSSDVLIASWRHRCSRV